MKTKIVLFSILSLFIFSCSSDNNSGSDPQNPQSTKLIETININGRLFKYNFNDNKTVQSLDFSVTNSILFKYSENRISSIEYDDKVWEFMYDSNGKINSFSSGNDNIDVVYNSAENSYFYENNDGVKINLTLTQDGDVKKYSLLYTQTDETVIHEYFYDNSKNGVLTNSNNIAVYLVMVTKFYDVGLYASKKPAQTFRSNDVPFSFENTYSEDGFLTKSIINSNGTPANIYYAYNQ